ncbi:MAG: hypothetical protein ACYC1R_10945 [Coriobacteriia bacterium]
MTKKLGGVFAGLKKPKTDAGAEASAAQKEYDERISAAFAALAGASAPWDKAVKDAAAALESAKVYGTRKLGSLAGLTLFEHALATPSGTVNLEAEQVRVAVDTAGNLMQSQRASLGRVAAGGLLFGPAGAIVGGMFKKSQTHDNRELYILVESDIVAAVAQCDPDKGGEARQFVAKIQTTAAGAPARGQQRVQSIAQCQQHLDDMVIQRFAALVALRAAVATAQAGTARLDVARAALG